MTQPEGNGFEGDPLAGDDIFLRTRDARFAAQLSLLPRLTQVQAPLLVTGEPGTGRRCLARHVLRLLGKPQANEGENTGTQCNEAAHAPVSIAEIDAHALSANDVELQLAALRRRANPGTASTREDAAIDSVARIDSPRLRSLLVLDVHLLSAQAQAALLAICDSTLRHRTGAAAHASKDSDQCPLQIVATADDRLDELARAGQFDARLLAHLCAINVRMPRLRERSDDIVPLAMRFVRNECERSGRVLPLLTPGAVDRLLAHSWRGNVPELHAVMRAALARCRRNSIAGADVRLGECQSTLVAASLQESKRELVLRFEKSVVENLLQTSQGNIAKAARLAQKNRRAFFELMRKHGIDAQRFREQSAGAT